MFLPSFVRPSRKLKKLKIKIQNHNEKNYLILNLFFTYFLKKFISISLNTNNKLLENIKLKNNTILNNSLKKVRNLNIFNFSNTYIVDLNMETMNRNLLLDAKYFISMLINLDRNFNKFIKIFTINFIILILIFSKIML